MPYSDSKTRKVRGRSWTKEDERRWRVDQKRQQKEADKAKLEHERKLAIMRGNGTLDAYLETERLKKLAEDDKNTQYTLESKRRSEELQLTDTAPARLSVGGLYTELAAAIVARERYGQPDGDWLEDPVDAITMGTGFGEEEYQKKGIKLQVHLCLDCSNSMVHNNTEDVALKAIKEMYLGLIGAAEQLPPGSLVVHLWTWAKGTDGKGTKWYSSPDNSNLAGKDPRGITKYLYPSMFDGEDTWISPLFQKLEEWELNKGDWGAYKLDIIISDGVLEHPTDARMADQAQERRDGSLQSVILNFLPQEEWADFRVPNRCVQYPATPDNLASLMRSVLGDWLVRV